MYTFEVGGPPSKLYKKSRIQETKILSTDADSSTGNKKLLSKLFLPPPGSVLDTTLLETGRLLEPGWSRNGYRPR